MRALFNGDAGAMQDYSLQRDGFAKAGVGQLACDRASRCGRSQSVRCAGAR